MKGTCGCCEGVEILTPARVANRPGLGALAYRAGAHGAFLETMKARLSSHEFPALRALTTREEGDFAIALLDAWALLADVLTFYQERIANEGYLRTATERRSILELARLVGYRLRPGVASSVYLSFTLEEGYQAEIPAGTRTQSLPGPGELPQSFEVSAPFRARAGWNRLKPRLTRPQAFLSLPQAVFLKGVQTNLQVGDPLILVDFVGEAHFFLALGVETEPAADRTRVALTAAGATGLLLAELQRLVAVENVPEEEGPFSLSIGGRAVDETRAVVKGLSGYLADETITALHRQYAVRQQLPRLEQTIRILRALNLDILAEWTEKIYRRYCALAAHAGVCAEKAALSSSKSINLDMNRISKLLGGVPKASGPFSREIADVEIRAMATSLKRLTAIVQDGGISDEEKSMEIRGVIFALDQLHYVFNELGFESLSKWLSTFIPLLSGAIGRRPMFPAEPSHPPVPTSLSLGQLVGGLVKAPSLPPRNALRLGRPFKQVFSAKANLYPEFLTVMHPILRDKLYTARKSVAAEAGSARVYALRTTASLFGHNVPEQITGYSTNGSPTTNEWTPDGDEKRNVIFLENANEKIVAGSYVVIHKPESSPSPPISIIEARTRPRTTYGISAKTTKITLPPKNEWWDPKEGFAIIRGTTVYTQSEELELAEEPIEEDVKGESVELDGLYEGFESGQWLVVAGERTDIPGVTGVAGSELVMLAGVVEDRQKISDKQGNEIDLPGDTLHTVLRLASPLAYSYRRDTLTIHGNVVKATHGETRTEVLGSGDASRPMQRFTLRQSPLTHLAALTPSGSESTLEVRVNDVLWHEADSLALLDPDDRRYITLTDDEEKNIVVFGEGRHGARPPTGVENIRAVYRTGIGKAGNVAAGKISLLGTKPLGVKSVINPLPATGGGDRDSRDQARRNAPLPVMALDRLVSLQDYADFARVFAGIGKSSVARLSDGRRELVHLTIAGAGDIPISEDSDLYISLGRALRQWGDPFQAVEVELRELLLLVVVAQIRLLPDYQWESVEPGIRAAMLDTFSFERRELGQDVTLSEVIGTIQAVEGVAYVDVERLDTVDQSIKSVESGNHTATIEIEGSCKDHIPVSLAEVAGADSRIRPAQLAYLNSELPDTLLLSEIPS